MSSWFGFANPTSVDESFATEALLDLSLEYINQKEPIDAEVRYFLKEFELKRGDRDKNALVTLTHNLTTCDAKVTSSKQLMQSNLAGILEEIKSLSHSCERVLTESEETKKRHEKHFVFWTDEAEEMKRLLLAENKSYLENLDKQIQAKEEAMRLKYFVSEKTRLKIIALEKEAKEEEERNEWFGKRL